VPWNELKERFDEVKEGLSQEYLPGFGFNQTALQELPSQAQASEQWPLSKLMSDYRVLQCQNPRDKAYELRALAVDGADLPVDYSKSVLHVFFWIFCRYRAHRSFFGHRQ
jgi:hypothetical protein